MGAELTERVRAIVPQLADEAAEAERLRKPTDLQIRLIEETGLFRLMVPRCYGGLELDLDSFVDAGLELARADTSIAWVACFYVEHNWMLCQLPEGFQKELYRDRSAVLAPGSISPSTRVASVEGGYRISGRCRWATGAMHASWAIVGGIAGAGTYRPSFRLYPVPMDELEIDDVWHVAGMVATGSNDLVLDDVFVPAERTVEMADLVSARAPGSKIHAGALYRTPMVPILALTASMPVIGHARAMVDEFRERLAGHHRMNAPGGPQSQRAAAQMRLARAEIEARQAELLLRDSVADVMRLRERATLADRARWAASITHAMHQAREAIQRVVEGSGASVHFLDHRLQRAQRDANVACAHVVFDRDGQYENHGRLLLGLEPHGGLC